MFSLTLNPRFKKLYLVSSFVGQEEGVNIVDEYDKKKIRPMFLKYYHHLHPMTKFVVCVDDGSFIMDIFQQTASTSETSKELATKE
jgi:hypothetical protein